MILSNIYFRILYIIDFSSFNQLMSRLQDLLVGLKTAISPHLIHYFAFIFIFAVFIQIF